MVNKTNSTAITTNLIDGFKQFAVRAEQGSKCDKFVHIDTKKDLFVVKTDTTAQNIKDVLPLVKKQLQVLSKDQASELVAQVEKTREAYEKAAKACYFFQGTTKANLKAQAAALSEIKLQIEAVNEMSASEKAALYRGKDKAATAADKAFGELLGTFLPVPSEIKEVASLKVKILALKTTAQVEGVKKSITFAKELFEKKYAATYWDRNDSLKKQVSILDDLVKTAETHAETVAKKAPKAKVEKEKTSEKEEVRDNESDYKAARAELDASDELWTDLETDIRELRRAQAEGERGLSQEIKDKQEELKAAKKEYRANEKAYVKAARHERRELAATFKKLDRAERRAKKDLDEARADGESASTIRKLEQRFQRAQEKANKVLSRSNHILNNIRGTEPAAPAA